MGEGACMCAVVIFFLLFLPKARCIRSISRTASDTYSQVGFRLYQVLSSVRFNAECSSSYAFLGRDLRKLNPLYVRVPVCLPACLAGLKALLLVRYRALEYTAA